MTPGTKVGARRWPYSAEHPDCWGRPWAGTVLAVNNPRAWAGTVAFPIKRRRKRKLMRT